MEWNIVKGEAQCQACGKGIAEGEAYFSALYDEGAEFVRKDYCPPCWPQAPQADAYSFWKTRVPTEEERQSKFVDDEIILNFFTRLENETDPLKRNFRYVLGLFLMRKRHLKFKDVVRDETGEALLLHARREDKDYTVYITELTDEEILHVTDEVGQILNVQL